MSGLYRVVATFFFVGLIPCAAGTWGSLAAMGLVGLLPARGFLPALVLTFLVLLALGVPAASWAERHYGRKDPSACVVDEVLGYLVAVAWTQPPTWRAACAAFFLFRAADILKVPPARRLEALPGGVGIVLDDLVAGLYTLVVMAGLRWAGLV